MIEIIPVIDIKKGNAVRAYRGEREKYKELGDVLKIAEKYRMNNFNKIYIADLDAIMLGFKLGNFNLIKA
ncbi:MAG: HisA/HisF-related TIM barrel protein, partial [Candidatus Altarchaeum sp.]|nr:HisA/HisF-related TIM barrel protein [Candidatus Altarchaeum sp.]